LDIYTFAAEMLVAVAGGACHYAYNMSANKYKRSKLEKKYPIAGEYISRYEDEENGAVVWRTANVSLYQSGDKISGKTELGDTVWDLDGHLFGNHLIGRYSAESHYNEGVGNFFLRIKDRGMLDGIWSGFDAANNKVTSGRYIFRRKIHPEIKQITKAAMPSILRIAEKQLGDSYVNETSLFSNKMYGYYALVCNKVVGFCAGRNIPTQNFLDKHPAINGHLKSLGASETLGILTCIAVDEDYKVRGIGEALSKTCTEKLISEGAKTLAATAWKSSKGIHIGGLLKRHGFEQVMEIPLFWHEDSLVHNYQCPECGAPPCKCSAVLYVKHIPDEYPRKLRDKP